MHLIYRPTAAAAHPTDVDVSHHVEEGETVELQIPNNSLETVTTAVVHRSKRSDNEPVDAATTTTPKQQTSNSQGSGAQELPPIVSVQIKGKPFILPAFSLVIKGNGRRG